MELKFQTVRTNNTREGETEEKHHVSRKITAAQKEKRRRDKGADKCMSSGSDTKNKSKRDDEAEDEGLHVSRITTKGTE